MTKEEKISKACREVYDEWKKAEKKERRLEEEVGDIFRELGL